MNFEFFLNPHRVKGFFLKAYYHKRKGKKQATTFWKLKSER